mmetsp:Transcript_6957/g.12820  ORF Transcript_6957/g.12820 Transcript_6957/m.12820 type:complete len:193 (+) Transcript_6957:88-666(+)
MDLSHVGKHCHLKDCRKLDFLPFRCGHCKLSFCLEHRLPKNHACEHYTPPRPPVATVCKDCNRSILQEGDLAVPALLKRHYAQGECKKFKVEKPHRCNFVKATGRRCKKREFDEIICKHCGLNFCIKHRHAEDHKCAALAKKKLEQKTRRGATGSNKGAGAAARSCGSQARRGRGSGTNLAHSRLVKQFSSR